MVQITFTTSLVAAVVACAYFADATPVASFGIGEEIEKSAGFRGDESHLYGDEIKPFEYEPYGNKYHHNHHDRVPYHDSTFTTQPFFKGAKGEGEFQGYEASEFHSYEFEPERRINEHRGPRRDGRGKRGGHGGHDGREGHDGHDGRDGFERHERHENEKRPTHRHHVKSHQKPNVFFKDNKAEENFHKSRFDAEKDEEDKRELEKDFKERAHSEKSFIKKDEEDNKREKDFKEVDKEHEDRKFREKYDTEFDKSAYELGYGYDKGIKYDKGYGYSKGYNQEFEKQFDQLSREDQEAEQFRKVQLGYENFKEREVKDRDEKDLDEKFRIQKDQERRKDSHVSDDDKDNEFRFRNRKFAKEQPRNKHHHFDEYTPRV